MRDEELIALLKRIVKERTESDTLELKSAKQGCPQRLYDTLSSFSNTKCGIIVFGVDDDFHLCGVYDLKQLQVQVAEQCKQMQPEVRVAMTPLQYEGKDILAVEVPEIEQTQKPCFYKGKGRLTGSYVRVGDQDVQMSEYEIYNIEAFKSKTQDELRLVERATDVPVDVVKLQEYLFTLKKNRPNLSSLSDGEILELNGYVKQSYPTLAYVLMFSIYPQGLFPNLCLNATVVPGKEIGQTAGDGVRFTANKKIEGTLPEMIEEAVEFVIKNMSVRTVINQRTGKREDVTEYPVIAVREAIVNAIVHRDYSLYTENQPITLNLFQDRLEVANPGGLFGRVTVDDLGKVIPDTRNPNIAKIMELMAFTENRYSGIPTIRRLMEERGLPAPKFENYKGTFKVTLYNSQQYEEVKNENIPDFILTYCVQPKSAAEIAERLNIKTVKYLKATYLQPLLDGGKLKETLPDKPKSKFQKYVSV